MSKLQYEYYTLRMDTGKNDNLLNALAIEGWRLVDVIYAGGSSLIYAYFERERSDSSHLETGEKVGGQKR